MKPVEALVVLELESGKFVSIVPRPMVFRGYRAKEIHCFGYLPSEEQDDLRLIAAACNAPIHFY